MSRISNGLKVLACGLGALAITVTMSLSFVTSTATAPSIANPTVQVAKLSAKPHVWFGQSRPAVLVD